MRVHLFSLSVQPYFGMAYTGEKNGIWGSPEGGGSIRAASILLGIPLGK
jgi:hypothetical protein